MKKNILNRAMFRQVKSPAYGTGISANLVSSEERQRYNYGGRVGYRKRGYVRPAGVPTIDDNIIPTTQNLPWNQELYYDSDFPISYNPYKLDEGIETRGDEMPLYARGYTSEVDYGPKRIGKTKDKLTRDYRGFEDLSMEELLDVQKGEKGDVSTAFSPDTSIQPELSDEEKIIATQAYEEGPDETLIQDKVVVNPNEATLQAGKEFAPAPGIKDTDTLDIEALVDKYYDKEGSLGKAQLGLAGQVLKAGFQKKSDAAGTIGDAMGAFGTSIQTDKDAMKKLAATGEIQRELYRMSRAEEGKQDRLTKQFAQDIKEIDEDKESTPEQKYLNYKGAFVTTFKRPPTGQEHKQMIANFDEELAGESIVLSPQKKRDGKTIGTVLSPGDKKKLANASEGAPIIIGEQIFVKDSDSADGTGMTEVSTLEELKTFNKIKKQNAGKKILGI